MCKYAFFESLTILSLSWWTVGWGGPALPWELQRINTEHHGLPLGTCREFGS